MRNISQWRPSRYVATADGSLTCSRAKTDVGVGSRLITHLVGNAYAKHGAAYFQGRLCDMGCGRVPLYGLYRDHVEEIVCVDWPGSPHAMLHVDLFCDLGRPLPFANDSFDTVVLSDVLEHIREPKQFLAEIRRCLCPNGHLIASVPFMYWLHERPHDYFRYTEYGLKYMLADTDLELVKLVPLGGPLGVVCDVTAKMVARRGWSGQVLAAMVQTLATAMTTAALGGRHGKSHGEMPLEYFFVAMAPS
jgi:SAM-dependent methyltransferase